MPEDLKKEKWTRLLFERPKPMGFGLSKSNRVIKIKRLLDLMEHRMWADKKNKRYTCMSRLRQRLKESHNNQVSCFA